MVNWILLAAILFLMSAFAAAQTNTGPARVTLRQPTGKAVTKTKKAT
jgi:hypothetical protein